MTWAERALAATPGGAQTRSKRASAFPWTEPGFLVRGYGPRVWDVNGREYIDWICGLGAISLGYRYKPVDDEVRHQMNCGVSFSLPTTLEVEVAEQTCDVLGAEQVRFTKTGSEATEGAMRIARLATGRDMIVSIGYHGWHAQHDAANESHPGVPDSIADLMIGMPWGQPLGDTPDIDAVAAVLVEVCRDDPPPGRWVEHLRQWCSRHGAILIFDEIVTGFRWALRGAREYFGVEPDLACYGKGMANGYPLSCIVGPKALMDHASYVSGTFGGETLSLAAAAMAMDIFRREPVIETMWASGQALMDGFNTMGGDLQMVGYPCHPRIVGESRLAFIKAAAAEGVLFHPSGFNVSYSHTEAVVKETLAACERALVRTPPQA